MNVVVSGCMILVFIVYVIAEVHAGAVANLTVGVV